MSTSNLDQFPFKVLVFRRATKDVPAAVLVDSTIIAPSQEIATLLAAFQLKEEDRSPEALVNIDIKVSYV